MYVLLLLLPVFLFGSIDCDARITSKTQENFCERSLETFSKLLYARDKDNEKMVEYVMRLKKDIEKTFKVKLMMKDMLNFVLNTLEEKDIPISYEQISYFRKSFKTKYDIPLPEAKGEMPSRLVYSMSCMVAGTMLTYVGIRQCGEWGMALQNYGFFEYVEYLKGDFKEEVLQEKPL